MSANTLRFSFVFTLLAIPSLVFGQGSLTPPPGPPAPIFKTLDQVEPRIPISSLPFTITQSGSYYLTGNLSLSGDNGITISSGDVVLDLNGFALVGNNTSFGIRVLSVTNLVIRNGTIKSWHQAISAQVASAITVEKINAVANPGGGIQVGTQSFVSKCLVTGVTEAGAFGITAGSHSIIADCDVSLNSPAGGFGITVSPSCAVLRCVANANTGVSAAIDTSGNCLVADCVANSNINGSANGISTGNDCRITNCLANNNHTDGIVANANCMIIGCKADNNANGIHVKSTINDIEDNSVINNTASGILADVNKNFIVKNRASGNGATGMHNYHLAAGNFVGPIVIPPQAGAAIDGNVGGTGVTSTDPWANFSYLSGGQ
jgi:parallel beta-helix repeat protein